MQSNFYHRSSGCSGKDRPINAITNLNADEIPRSTGNLFVKKWREIVNIFGSKILTNRDWSSCWGGYLVLQLESAFFPDHDLLLFGHYLGSLIPMILLSNGSLIAYGIPCSSEPLQLHKLRINITYSLSFGARISLLNGSKAVDIRYRYPSASKHGDVVHLSGVFKLDRYCRLTKVNNELLVGRLPITYRPYFEQSFLVTGLTDHHTVSVKPSGHIVLNSSGQSQWDSLNDVVISLDNVCFTALNTLAPLSLNLPCDYVRAVLKTPSNWKVVSPLRVEGNCSFITVSGLVSKRIQQRKLVLERDVNNPQLIAVFPPRLRPKFSLRFTVPIYDPAYGVWSYGRLKLGVDGNLIYLNRLPVNQNTALQVSCSFVYVLC